MSKNNHIVVIGGGAAGFFAAIACAEHHPQAQVILLEKTNKLLAKVKISGGGRCNVTHACFDPKLLIKNYPRGSKQLRKAFGHFHTQHTLDWFESRGVPLKAEEDGRMFPTTDDSQTIIDCLLQQARKAGVQWHTQTAVKRLSNLNGKWKVIHQQGELLADAVIIATGGSPKASGLQWLADLGLPIVDPQPSLFTFNYPKDPICDLMGISVPKAKVRLQGSKFVQEGPLLITHWGMSGPAILKLSAFAARWLAEREYRYGVQVAWMPDISEQELQAQFMQERSKGSKKQIGNWNPAKLPQRLWQFLLDKAQVAAAKLLMELSNKDINRLVQLLTNDTYQAQGKTTFKEEFVTCGGIDLSAIDFKSMQARELPGLFFAGEVLNIDGVTGGFNFQAAWTTGYLAGTNAGKPS